MSSKKARKITYFYDALCGWCYGFSPVIVQLNQAYKEELDFEVISGGMVVGSRVGPIGQVAGYIQSAYRMVEEKTGVKFGEAFLKDILAEGKAVFSSVPAAVALSVFKRHRPEDAIDYTASIQKGIYFDGKRPLDSAFYAKVAGHFDLDEREFSEAMENPDALRWAEEDFSKTREFGVSGFPTLLFEDERQDLHLLTRGYAPFSALKSKLTAVLQD